MLTRRPALMGAAIAAMMAMVPAALADDLKLAREHVDLVAPPFVHPHEQATKSRPKTVEFKLTVQEKEVVIDDAGTKMWHRMLMRRNPPRRSFGTTPKGICKDQLLIV